MMIATAFNQCVSRIGQGCITRPFVTARAMSSFMSSYSRLCDDADGVQASKPCFVRIGGPAPAYAIAHAPEWAGVNEDALDVTAICATPPVRRRCTPARLSSTERGAIVSGRPTPNQESAISSDPPGAVMPQLSALRESRRENHDWDAAYLEILATLDRPGFTGNILAPGATFPDFTLPNATGRFVALEDELAQGPVVLFFFRGAWCPFCKLMLDALAGAMPAIKAAGGRVLALTPETGTWPRTLQARHGDAFEVLADVDFGVGLLAGVVFKIPPLYRERCAALDFPQRHGNGGWALPVPATFIIGQDGLIAWRFFDVDFTHRAEPADIVAALGRM
jgi:peroxiredoxin